MICKTSTYVCLNVYKVHSPESKMYTFSLCLLSTPYVCFTPMLPIDKVVNICLSIAEYQQ